MQPARPRSTGATSSAEPVRFRPRCSGGAAHQLWTVTTVQNGTTVAGPSHWFGDGSSTRRRRVDDPARMPQLPTDFAEFAPECRCHLAYSATSCTAVEVCTGASSRSSEVRVDAHLRPMVRATAHAVQPAGIRR